MMMEAGQCNNFVQEDFKCQRHIHAYLLCSQTVMHPVKKCSIILLLIHTVLICVTCYTLSIQPKWCSSITKHIEKDFQVCYYIYQIYFSNSKRKLINRHMLKPGDSIHSFIFHLQQVVCLEYKGKPIKDKRKWFTCPGNTLWFLE